MNDLEPVAFGELGLGPSIAGHDLAIQFDGDPIGFHAELPDQGIEREFSRQVAIFSVDDQFHACRSSQAACDLRKGSTRLG